MDTSSTVGSRLRCPSGLIPPSTYPVACWATAGSAIAARLPPRAAASALRSSEPLTGTTATTGSLSTVATRVLKQRAGSTRSAVAASAPYDSARGSCRYSCTLWVTFSRRNSAVAGVPWPASRLLLVRLGAAHAGRDQVHHC